MFKIPGIIHFEPTCAIFREYFRADLKASSHKGSAGTSEPSLKSSNEIVDLYSLTIDISSPCIVWIYASSHRMNRLNSLQLSVLVYSKSKKEIYQCCQSCQKQSQPGTQKPSQDQFHSICRWAHMGPRQIITKILVELTCAICITFHLSALTEGSLWPFWPLKHHLLSVCVSVTG